MSDNAQGQWSTSSFDQSQGQGLPQRPGKNQGYGQQQRQRLRQAQGQGFSQGQEQVEARVGAIVKVQYQCLLSLKIILSMVRWVFLRPMASIWCHGPARWQYAAICCA